MDLSAFTNDPVGYLNILIQVVLPIVVGLVTTRVTHARAKAVLLLALTAVNQFAFEWLRALTGSDGGGTFDMGATVWAVIIGFLVSVGFHFGLLRPADVTGSGSIAERNGRTVAAPVSGRY